MELLDTSTPLAAYFGRIDHDAVLAYANATNDHNELYALGEAVPPLFTAILVRHVWQSPTGRAALDRIIGMQWGVHAEHDVWIHAPFRPWTSIEWHADARCMRQTSAGVLTALHVQGYTPDGELAVEHYWSNLSLKATVDADWGPAAPDHTFREAYRSSPVATRTISIDRDQGYRYAGVSFDHAHHAMDDESARAEGYPSKILQGLCTLALCSTALVDLVAGGDPRRLRRLAARFAAPAFPARDLDVHVYAIGDAEGRHAYAYEAVQDGVVVIKHGRAEVVAG